MKKICISCTLEKDLDLFKKDKRTPSGKGSYCKDCHNKNPKNKCKPGYLKNWYKENQDKVLQYRLEHKEEQSIRDKERYKIDSRVEYRKKYYEENKEKIFKRIYEKRKSNPIQRLKDNLRKRLWDALKGNSHKPGSHIKDLGCTMEELKIYIEAKFYPHPITKEIMTWENWGRGYGKWQIDHSIEFQDVDLNNKEQFLKVCHFTNLQPLWLEDHIEKTWKNDEK